MRTNVEMGGWLPVRVGADFPSALETGLNRIPPWWSVLSTVSSGLSAYHGYMRTQSVGWAVGWALVGGLFPVITLPVAIAQGFGKRA